MYEEDKDRNWNREPEEERPKKGGILKKAAWITAGRCCLVPLQEV